MSSPQPRKTFRQRAVRTLVRLAVIAALITAYGVWIYRVAEITER